jgi:hypothetical protein
MESERVFCNVFDNFIILKVGTGTALAGTLADSWAASVPRRGLLHKLRADGI